MRVFVIAIWICWLVSSESMGQEVPKAVLPFLEDHCYDCHDDSTQKGNLNLQELKLNLDDSQASAKWVLVHDRLQAGEMPPREKNAPPNDERDLFLKELSRSLIDYEKSQDQKNGRSVWRRLNRLEYENTMRDLLSAPWLDLKDLLPEDGRAHRFAKSARALDISHVQMARYMEASDFALRRVIAPGDSPHENKIRRFYARQDPSMTGKIFFNEFNRSTYRSMIPLLGNEGQPEVLNKTAPLSVGASHPEIRELESLGVLASSYEPIQPRFSQFQAPHDGLYKIRLKARSFTAAAIQKKNWIDADRVNLSEGQRDEPVSLYAISRRSQRKIASIDVFPEPQIAEFEAYLRQGEMIGPDAARLFRSRPPGPFHNPLATLEGVPGVAYHWLEVEGPFSECWPPEGHQLLFGQYSIHPPEQVPQKGVFTPKNPKSDSRRLLAHFIQRAYRRTVTDEDFDRFLPVIDRALGSGSHFSDAMIAGYVAVLCSPGFLFLEEPVGELDSSSLASRLSYFLWNSAPDKQLRSLKEEEQLKDDLVLRQETERLLSDSRVEDFIHAFLDSWLDLGEIHATSPDENLYPDYYLDDLLTESAIDETRLFFKELVVENHPARFLVSSPHTYLNERLAEHYGIDGVKGVGMQRVVLPKGSVRGGLMTQASVLKVTANGTTTSPVVRGNWVLERILGYQSPPPPPGTPAIEPDIRGATTIRQQLEKHRDLKSCYSCHSRIDPPGLALEAFDVLGGYRQRYRTLGKEGDAVFGFGKNGQPFSFRLDQPVDASGEMRGGFQFEDILGFKKILLRDERLIARNMANQLITYATGTPVRFSDREVLEEILNKSKESDYGLRSLIHEIVQSPLFRRK